MGEGGGGGIREGGMERERIERGVRRGLGARRRIVGMYLMIDCGFMLCYVVLCCVVLVLERVRELERGRLGGHESI